MSANTNKQKAMSEKQVAFIRDLFKQVKDTMPEQEQENLINKMKAHLDGTNIQSTKWASAAIDKLKGYKTKMVSQKLKELNNTK
jgi:hypothetical protein